MWFSYAREEGFPSQFPAKNYPVTVDVLEAGLIFCFVLLAVCFYIVLPGRRGLKCLSLGSRVTFSLFLGLVTLLGNFGQDWEVGHIHSKTPYKVGTGHEIVADIGIKIGFRSVNVTLKSNSETQKNTPLENEVINYNERFEWSWDQGRFGFGPYAGLLQREFREAQYRGLPLPILWIVDYFVFDGEGLRFGRFYRTAGWYCHILMWTAFGCWILANVFYASVIRYGSYFLAISGGLQLLACIIWAVVRNPMPLRIPFEDATITTDYGPSFYLTLIGGILSVVLALIIYILDIFLPDETAEFFNIDALSDYDELHLTPEELKNVRHISKNKIRDLHLNEMSGTSDETHIDQDRDIILMKRRSTVRFTKISPYRNVLSDFYEEEIPIYSNVEHNEMSNESLPVLPPREGPALPPKRRIK